MIPILDHGNNAAVLRLGVMGMFTAFLVIVIVYFAIVRNAGDMRYGQGNSHSATMPPVSANGMPLKMSSRATGTTTCRRCAADCS
ncbi:hypothetical protein GCM10027343_27000 [Noviherbaspirillum agri]